jgi:hypothetical protein
MGADGDRHVTLFGLEVTDDVGYAQYRNAMAPILERHGGALGCDFLGAVEVLAETSPRRRAPDLDGGERRGCRREHVAVTEDPRRDVLRSPWTPGAAAAGAHGGRASSRAVDCRRSRRRHGRHGCP